MKNSESLNDAIFANILLGGKMGLLDFRLPRAMAKYLPYAGKWLGLRLALITLMFVGLGVWGFNMASQALGKPALTQFVKNWIAQENAYWHVDLYGQTDTQMLANQLKKTLLTARFQLNQYKDRFGMPPMLTQNTITYAQGV